MERDPTRMCEVLVGLSDVDVWGWANPSAGALKLRSGGGRGVMLDC